MAHLAGKSGAVERPADSELSGIISWTLDYDAEALETTDFQDDGVRGYIVGCTGWSGSFEQKKDGAPTTIGTSTTIKLKESETSDQFWSGSAILTKVSASVTFDGVVTYTYDFQGTGALTVAAA